MNVYDRIATNILHNMKRLEEDEEFMKNCSFDTVFEYVSTRAQIKPKRLSKILEVGAKRRTTIYEVYKIAFVLNVPINDIITNEKSS